MSRLFKVLIYLSLGFLVAALAAADYLEIPEVRSPGLLAASFMLLFSAFAFEFFPWNRLLILDGLHAKRECVLASIGLSVFGKYIPGKIWALVGRAEYLATRLAIPRERLGVLALDAQVIVIWIGLTLGSLVAPFYDVSDEILAAAAIAWLAMTGALFTDALRNGLQCLLRPALGRGLLLPRLRIGHLNSVAAGYFGQWVLWCLGYWLFVLALSDTSAPAWLGLSFALAASVGIVALVMPGGIGVREGILVLAMTNAGISTQEATSISIAARLWFLVGEAFIFATALAAHRWCGKSPAHSRRTGSG